MKHNPYTKELKTQVFDIETTGLYPVHDIVINSGFCSPDGSDFYQTFLEDPMLEASMLSEILDHLSELDAVITYNGNRFDLPFILTRARKYSLTDRLPLFWSIDLYKWLKKYWPMAKQMEHLNQKSVEFAMGLTDERDDKIGGGECIPLYTRYLSIGDEEAKNLILLHNGDDVRQLAKISQKLSFLPFHQIVFNEGTLVKTDYFKIITTGSEIKGNKLLTKGKTVKGLMPAAFYEESFKFEYDSSSGSIELAIYPEEKDVKVFIDLNTLPVDKSLFEESYSGFLILKDGKEINYKWANKLVEEIIKNVLR